MQKQKYTHPATKLIYIKKDDGFYFISGWSNGWGESGKSGMKTGFVLIEDKQMNNEQEQVNKAVIAAREEFNSMVEKSGLSQSMFIATSKASAQFLGNYEFLRQQVLDKGLEMPELISGVTVTIKN
jgi:hypothetical protein